MRIAFDHQTFAEQHHGGISRYFVEIASRLAAAHKVTIVVPFHINEHLNGLGPSKIVSGGWSLPGSLRGRTRLTRYLNQVCAPLFWRTLLPDVVHETYYALNAIGRGRKRVLTVYDMIHEVFASALPESASLTARKRAAVARADHIICISAHTQQDLIRLFGISAARTTVVHMGYSAPASDIHPSPKSQRPYLLYVGNRAGYKNFLAFSRAFASSRRLHDFEILAFGGGPFTHQEKERMNAFGIADRVRHAAGNDRALAEAYANAAAFVYPSRYEGFGIPPLEAMSYGCPVICANVSSIPEVVGDAGTYFDPHDDEAIRDTLERTLFDRTRLHELREKGRGRAGLFSWDECAKKTAAVYAEL